jgi:hypothetical protein
VVASQTCPLISGNIIIIISSGASEGAYMYSVIIFNI